MGIFHNNCPNGQFKCDILSGKYAVNLPTPARSENQDVFEGVAEMLENSGDTRQKRPIAQAKFYR